MVSDNSDNKVQLQLVTGAVGMLALFLNSKFNLGLDGQAQGGLVAIVMTIIAALQHSYHSDTQLEKQAQQASTVKTAADAVKVLNAVPAPEQK